MASRRKARETLLKLLYLAESREISLDQAYREMNAIDQEITITAGDEEKDELKPFAGGLAEDQKEYVLSMGRKIEQNREDLHQTIRSLLKNWDFSRVSRIDRLIMTIALAEMRYRPDIPPAVSMDEAIELAKEYSTEKSTAFINGILDTARKKLEHPPV